MRADRAFRLLHHVAQERKGVILSLSRRQRATEKKGVFVDALFKADQAKICVERIWSLRAGMPMVKAELRQRFGAACLEKSEKAELHPGGCGRMMPGRHYKGRVRKAKEAL